MKNIVVVGSQWGDEGKGKIVDWLSEQADVVIRFQGGHNAGHTLVIDGVTYKLIEIGSKNVLIKGGHLTSTTVQDIFVSKSEIKIFNSQRYNTKNTHGTGCTLSSAITTFLSCGKPIKKSCELGIKYVNSGIKTNPKYGKGHGPINHLNSINIERKFK